MQTESSVDTPTGLGSAQGNPADQGALSPSLTATAPGQLKIIKRNGTVVPYTADKISVAMTKAFLAVEGGTAAASPRIRELVQDLAEQMTATFKRRMPSGGTLHIEEIQDQVELALMRSGEQKVARSYVLYREQRAQERSHQQNLDPDTEQAVQGISVIHADGTKGPLDIARIQTIVGEACEGLSDVDPQRIIDDAMANMYDGISVTDVATSILITARTLVEEEPNYTYASARLLLDELRTEALTFLDVTGSGGLQTATQTQMTEFYPLALKGFIDRGVELDLISPKLQEYDFAQLGAAMRPERDHLFTYLGLQTLYDRYFIHWNETRIELPQVFFMRVAMGLAAEEADANGRAIEFYNLLSSFDYMSSTPTLFNAGTLRPQLSSCFLTTVPDNLHGIYGAIQDNAMLSKWAGGLGGSWTAVRGTGSYIQGTNGESQGVIPFLKLHNDQLVAVNQGGKRRGSGCAYLETWHTDILDFLDLRKNTGDDRRRAHDMNTANWIPDLFMKRMEAREDWTLFRSNEVPDLHDLYGSAFEKRYTEYEQRAKNGEIFGKTMPAIELWKHMLKMLFETGHPWITFKDPCNVRSPQDHCGVIHSSNLCTEITLNTGEEETAVCNLGSVVLDNHLGENGEIDHEKLKETVRIAVRALDNVIDINFYPTEAARCSNQRHRPIGLGVMGLQNSLFQRNVCFGSDEAVEFNDEFMEAIAYYAYEASSDLAKERESYSTYEGSKWSRGLLPPDTIDLLEKERGINIDVPRGGKLDWSALREKIKDQGMRNSNVLAIAPTATISNIMGSTPCIEPTYKNLFVKSNLSGDFIVLNSYLVRDLKKLGLWDKEMADQLKYHDGELDDIDEIPDDLKKKYSTAFSGKNCLNSE